MSWDLTGRSMEGFIYIAFFYCRSDAMYGKLRARIIDHAIELQLLARLLVYPGGPEDAGT